MNSKPCFIDELLDEMVFSDHSETCKYKMEHIITNHEGCDCECHIGVHIP